MDRFGRFFLVVAIVLSLALRVVHEYALAFVGGAIVITSSVVLISHLLGVALGVGLLVGAAVSVAVLAAAAITVAITGH
jgi:hypothetical protein